LKLLNKVTELRKLKPELEIGWDGGINVDNAKQLSEGGVDVLNVGGAIQKAEDPKAAYDKLRLTAN
jgi:ribulose-phosphate 3-epimerase